MTHSCRIACLHFLMVVILALSACTSVKVVSEIDDAQLASLDTYAWHQSPRTVRVAGRVNDPIVAARIVQAIERELAALGIQKVEPGEADMWVTQHITVERKVKENDPYYAMYTAEVYEEGTLSIIFIAPAPAPGAGAGAGSAPAPAPGNAGGAPRSSAAGASETLGAQIAGRELWRGSSRTRLRDIAYNVGVNSPRFAETGDDPDWHINRLVEAILKKFPR